MAQFFFYDSHLHCFINKYLAKIVPERVLRLFFVNYCSRSDWLYSWGVPDKRPLCDNQSKTRSPSENADY